MKFGDGYLVYSADFFPFSTLVQSALALPWLVWLLPAFLDSVHAILLFFKSAFDSPGAGPNSDVMIMALKGLEYLFDAKKLVIGLMIAVMGSALISRLVSPSGLDLQTAAGGAAVILTLSSYTFILAMKHPVSRTDVNPS